jgi:lipopolysaccharide export LptBFGC system permease protein LptF
MFFLQLIKKAINKNDAQKLNSLAEINDRIVMPLFIPSLIILGSFLIITNKEIINYTLLKIITFISGVFLIIMSEILLDLSSKKIQANVLLYLAPFFLFIVSLALLNYFLSKENKK